jgi:hypothetical protein
MQDPGADRQSARVSSALSAPSSASWLGAYAELVKRTEPIAASASGQRFARDARADDVCRTSHSCRTHWLGGEHRRPCKVDLIGPVACNRSALQMSSNGRARMPHRGGLLLKLSVVRDRRFRKNGQ